MGRLMSTQSPVEVAARQPEGLVGSIPWEGGLNDATRVKSVRRGENHN